MPRSESLLAKTVLPPEADPADLSPVLASPPWQRKKPRQPPAAVLALPPLPWEETAVWPEGERERWHRHEVFSDWLRRRSLEERVPAVLKSIYLGGFGSWEDLDDEALRRKIEERTAGMIKTSFFSILALLPDRLALALWEAFPPSCWYGGDPLGRFLTQVEARAIPGLVRFAGEHLITAVSFALPFRSPRLALPVAEALARFKSARPAARRWLLFHDECSRRRPDPGRGRPRGQAARDGGRGAAVPGGERRGGADPGGRRALGGRSA